MFDVIVVGGGPAGLSAALVLARACRSVLVIDQGMMRNAAARAMHGYLTRDGIPPGQLISAGRRELERYGVPVVQAEVVKARRGKKSFAIKRHDGVRHHSTKLLLCTGLRDQLPRLEGLAEFYGSSVHHCPYCDGWEWRGHRLAAYGQGKQALGLALSLLGWSNDVVVFTDGARRMNAELHRVAKRHGIQVCEQRIKRLDGRPPRLKSVVLEDGTRVARDALFFNTGQRQKSTLAEQLGCEFDRQGGVIVDHRERTCVPGLYLAGDASRDVQFAIQAAAEGAVAAVTINKEFQEEEGRVLKRARRVQHKA